MGPRLPEYTIEQILSAMAYAVMFSKDALGGEYAEMLERVAHDNYILRNNNVHLAEDDLK